MCWYTLTLLVAITVMVGGAMLRLLESIPERVTAGSYKRRHTKEDVTRSQRSYLLVNEFRSYIARCERTKKERL